MIRYLAFFGRYGILNYKLMDVCCQIGFKAEVLNCLFIILCSWVSMYTNLLFLKWKPFLSTLPSHVRLQKLDFFTFGGLILLRLLSLICFFWYTHSS